MNRKVFGFTLAEILIVLTIIGVMAVMTIPSLIQNSNSQQKIAQFKKAFNAASNAYATEFALKSAPAKWNDGGGKKLFDALTNQLNVKYYVNSDNNNEKLYEKPNVDDGKYSNYWIITEDGISYQSSYFHSNTTCISRAKVNSYKKTQGEDGALANSCLIVDVDIDGPLKGKNKHCSDKTNLNSISCDRFYLIVSKDGITAGNPDCTFAGRIMSDNVEYDETKCSEE